MYGDLKLTANAGLTRDNVAELVFNALTKAVTVEYNDTFNIYFNTGKHLGQRREVRLHDLCHRREGQQRPQHRGSRLHYPQARGGDGEGHPRADQRHRDRQRRGVH